MTEVSEGQDQASDTEMVARGSSQEVARAKLWVPSPALHKPATVAYDSNPNSQKVEVREPGVPDHPQLPKELEASLGYI